MLAKAPSKYSAKLPAAAEAPKSTLNPRHNPIANGPMTATRLR